MATGTTSNDREFLFRLQTLIIDGGTLVIKNIFDKKLPNVPLNVYLAIEKTTINRLRAQKTITRTQYDQLYPQSGQPPNTADIDITLLICLLRNLQSLGLNLNYSWYAPPQPADTSVEADLCRLKGFRNEVAHISSTSGFQQTVFQTKWAEIEQVLLRLNSTVPNPVPNLKQTIDGYKTDPFDPVAEIRIQTEIKQWRKMEKGLGTEIQMIKRDVTENVKEVLGLKADIAEVKKQGAILTHVDENVKILAKDIGIVKKDAEEVTKIEENVKTMTADVTNLKQHVEVMPRLQGNIQTLIEDVKRAKENIEKEQKNVEILKQNTIDLTKNVQEVTESVREVPAMKGDMKELKEHIVVIKEDVTEVKKNVASDQGGIFHRIFRYLFSPSSSSGHKVLQEDLVLFYRRQHRTISLPPLLLEEDTPFLQIYAIPDIVSVEVKRVPGGINEEKTPVTPFGNVFSKGNNLCSEIYLTAEAGLGKTAFSKRLTLAWCHAKKPLSNEKQYFSQGELEAINEFRFVFLLLLRDSSSECDIDDLIWNQIISQLGHDYIRKDLVNILCKERCLVILDGLDEWSHPPNSCKQGSSPIPHRKVRARTTVLTTTRPWKLSVSRLHFSQIDRKLEITGLNQTSTNALKESVISRLFHEKDKYSFQNRVTYFTRALKEKQITDLEAYPLLLMYLMCLLCNKVKVGQSQCDVYSQITELILQRTVQNYIELSPPVDLPNGDIPECFIGKIHCSQFYTFLKALGQLAYETLFRKTREENTLVFDGSVVDSFLNEQGLLFCLKTGLISQSKVPGTLFEQKSKVSFAHKTVQEFFAALYIHSTADQTSVPEMVLSKCKCVKDILEMSKILIFICGMNVNVSSLISREMMKIINEDELTREYRISLESSTAEYGRSHPLKDFQDMCISCCKEVLRGNEVGLCLQDVFIEGSCEQEQYRENLKHLTTSNKQNIRSVYINMHDIHYSSAQEVIEYFAVNDLENIEKIHYNGNFYSHILPLMNRSVKCLYLSCNGSYWSRLLLEKVKSLQKLEAIHIGNFTVSSEMESLYDYISQRHCMRQIGLTGLYGTALVVGPYLDLSQHSQLNNLTLGYIPVSKLHINMTSLEECRLNWSFKSDFMLRFINCVPADSKLNTFTFEFKDLDCPAAIETMLETLRLSMNVKHVKLSGIRIDNRELLSSEMVNIERVELSMVTMTASVLQGIVDVVQQQQQTVTVNIQHCFIEPEIEFVTLKQKIKSLREHFRVLFDSKGWFVFETVKRGDCCSKKCYDSSVHTFV